MKSRCMRTSRTSTNTTPLPSRLTAKLSRTKIAGPTRKRRSASRIRTHLLHKILVSSIPRRNTLARNAAMIAADRTSAAIADAADAGGGAVDAVAVEVEDARKAAVIFLLQSTRLRRAINARTILAAATTRAASKATLSSRVTIVARKDRASARLPLR